MDKSKWEYKKLGDIAIVSAGQGAPQGDNNYSSEGTPFVKAGNIESLVNGLSEYEIQKVNDEVVKSHRLKLYKAGSVLFAKSGMSCMKGLVYTLKNDCYVVSHLAIVTPKDINSHYLNYYFQVHKPNLLIKDSAYPSISLKDIENMIVLCPSHLYQQRIVAELDCLNEMIAVKQEQLKEFDKLAQSIFYDMVGDECKKKFLGDFCEVGTGSTPSRNNESLYYGGNIPWVRTTEVQNCNIYVTEETITKAAIEQTNCKVYPIGTILMAMYGQGKTRGQVAKLMIEAATNQACAAIIPNDKECKIDFLYEYLLLSYDKIRDMARGGNQANLNLQLVRSIPVPLPPLSLQQQFADKISAIEAQKELVKQSIAETQQLLDYTMDKYFGYD